MRKLVERFKNRSDSGMETAQVIMILVIVVGLIAFLFPTITSAISERGKKASDCIGATSFDGAVDPACQ